MKSLSPKNAGIWAGAAVAALAGYLALAGADPSGPQPSAKPPAPGEAAGTQEQFDEPPAIVQRFVSEMGRILKEGKDQLPTPAQLFEQAAKAKGFALALSPDPGQNLPAEAIYARARPAVVILGALAPRKGRNRAPAAFATGFVIHQDGFVVTNYHVIDAFQHMRAVGVMTHDGRVLTVKAVSAADPHNDLAVLKVDADRLTPLPVAAAVPVGATVYCLSHPVLSREETDSGFFAFTQGIVSGKYSLPLHGHAGIKVLAVTAEYAKGSSGAPILNQHGAVVGIACETRALVYEEEATDVQMTWKLARPASSLLTLLQPLPPAK